jgi:hypothetical protein
LKDAILNHHVLVGMSTEMVLFAKGQPDGKTRETDGKKPFEEWIYGKPPQPVEFVRFDGNHVIRLEVARMGETPVFFTKDEVAGLLRTDGTPLEAGGEANTRVAKVGDVERDPDTQAPAPPPSLRNPGEKLPADNQETGVMKPVQPPKQRPEPLPDANPDSEASPPANAQPPLPDASQPGPPRTQPVPPAGTSQPE